MAAWGGMGEQSIVLSACSTGSPNWHHSPAFVAAQCLLLDGAFYMPRHQRFSCAHGLRGHFGADEDLRVHGNVYVHFMACVRRRNTLLSPLLPVCLVYTFFLNSDALLECHKMVV